MKKFILIGLFLLSVLNFYTVANGLEKRERMFASGAAMDSKEIQMVQRGINNSMVGGVASIIFLLLISVASKSRGK